jgi:hypothetical protein
MLNTQKVKYCVSFTIFCYEACNWTIGFLKIVKIPKLHHVLESNCRTFYIQSFQVSFAYKFLVLIMRTFLCIQVV